MASNKSEAPTEPFKRALAHAARSLAELPDLGAAFNDLAVWRYHVAKARARGM